MGANGRAAAATLRSYRDLIHGMCLFYVWKAYAANGASGGISSGTAMEGWNNSRGQHPGDRNPPAGVPVWFGKKPSSSAGDVVISLGNGRVVCTDYPRYGVVGECTIQERQDQIGRPYLGWTETILGAAIDYADLTPAKTPEPATPIITHYHKENIVYVAFVNSGPAHLRGRFLVTPQGNEKPTALGLWGDAKIEGFPTVEINGFEQSFWKTVNLV